MQPLVVSRFRSRRKRADNLDDAPRLTRDVRAGPAPPSKDGIPVVAAGQRRLTIGITTFELRLRHIGAAVLQVLCCLELSARDNEEGESSDEEQHSNYDASGQSAFRSRREVGSAGGGGWGARTRRCS